MVQLSHPYMTSEKNIALTRWTFVGKVISLLFNTLSRFVIAFLARRKCLLILWLQSLSAMILEPPKIKSVTVSIFSPSICHEAMGLDAMILHNLYMCMCVYVCVYIVVWCMCTYIFVSQGSTFFHWHLVQLFQIFVWKNIFSTFTFFQNIFFFWKKILFVIIRPMLLNPLTPCVVFLWPSVKCRKPRNYRKEWKRTKKALAVSLPTDAPSTLLTSPSHFPFTTEVWSPHPRRPWGSALMCVCVCVFSKPEASIFSLPSDPAVEQTPHTRCASSQPSSYVSTKTDWLTDGTFPQHTWFLVVLQGHRL